MPDWMELSSLAQQEEEERKRRVRQKEAPAREER